MYTYTLRILDLGKRIDIDLFGFPHAVLGIGTITTSFGVSGLLGFLGWFEMTNGTE
jgi:hypothetical protein